MASLSDIAVVPHGQREIPTDGVLELYRVEGWWPERTAEQIRAVLRVARYRGRAGAAGSIAGGA